MSPLVWSHFRYVWMTCQECSQGFLSFLKKESAGTEAGPHTRCRVTLTIVLNTNLVPRASCLESDTGVCI